MASAARMLRYEDILLRPGALARAGVPARDALAFLDGLCSACRPVAIRLRWRPQSPDAGDDVVIEAAVDALADPIATFNLRDLGRPAARFGVPALRPADVREMIR